MSHFLAFLIAEIFKSVTHVTFLVSSATDLNFYSIYFSKSVYDLRNNTQSAFFKNVTSLSYLNGKFYWTNGYEVFAEELNDGIFYHNR